VTLGHLYKRILRFTLQYGGIGTKLAIQLAFNDGASGQDEQDLSGSLNHSGGSGEVHGVYVKAFCQGVTEILNVYKEHLLSIEQEYLRDRALTIPQVH